MDETERAPTNESLHQGDILHLEDENSDFNFKLATIINADCDMQNKKHDGVIAILPIYTFQQYLENFWLKNFYLMQRKSALDLLQQAVSIEGQHLNDLLSWMDQDGDTVLKLGASKVFEGYKLNSKQVEKAEEALLRLHNSLTGESTGKLEFVSKFAPASKEKEEKNSNGEENEIRKKQKLEKYCRDQILEAKKQMGDGHFFFTEVKGDNSIGYVVRMRRIYTIPVDSCFTSYANLQSSKTNGVTAYRISKFSPYYKFKVAQLFAQQYSRIGLPDETTALSELAISDMALRLQGNQIK